MKLQANRLVDAMETSRDRIAVMTFKPPPAGKRRPSQLGRTNLRVLNSSGSVAKKQLIEDINMLKLGSIANPAARDVSAALAAAVKTLHHMPVDTSRYGSKRSGHLFLITSKLDSGAISGDHRGVKVHVIGVGPVFNPSSNCGADGWCAAMSSPLDQVGGLQRIVADGIEIPVDKPPGAAHVRTIVSLLRMGVDVGVIQGGGLFLHPGEGCTLKGTLGDASFPVLLPGERKSLMVKIEVGDLPGWDSDPDPDPDALDIDSVERQLQATLGELTSTVLTVEAVYCHSHLSTPATTITTKAQVDVVRYVEGCDWSRSAQDVGQGTERPVVFADADGDGGNDVDGDVEGSLPNMSLVNSVLVQVLASGHSSSQGAWDAIEQLKEHVDASAVRRELGYQVNLENRFPPATGEVFAEPMMAAFERRFSLKDDFHDGHLNDHDDYGHSHDLEHDHDHDHDLDLDLDHGHGQGCGDCDDGDDHGGYDEDEADRTFRPMSTNFATTTAVTAATRIASHDLDTGGSDLLIDETPEANSQDSLVRVQSDSVLYRVPSRRIQQSPDEATRLWKRLEGYEEDDDELDTFSNSDDDLGDFEVLDDRDMYYRGVSRRSSVGQDTMLTYRDVRETDFSPWAV